jgi:hypothetical protein
MESSGAFPFYLLCVEVIYEAYLIGYAKVEEIVLMVDMPKGWITMSPFYRGLAQI